MERELFLKQLAENGYNVIYGAKKHFSTYDTVVKMPGRIAFVTLTIGIWQIYKPSFLYNTEMSLLLIIASIIALSISQYNSEKERYREIGNRLIKIHNELRKLYYQVKSSDKTYFNDESIESVRMNELLEEFYEISISKQIFLSDWIAHYKLFFQSQYEWIDEQKNFNWKDKIPLSFRIVVIAIIAFVIIFMIVTRGIGC